MRYIISMILFLYPALAWSEYNPQAIKAGMSEHSESFHIKNWRTAGDDVSVAETELKGVIISVSKNNTEVIASLMDAGQIAPAILRCMVLGTIGLSPKDEAQRSKIGALIQDAATTGSSRSLTMNDVKLDVSSKQVVGDTFLYCTLSPPAQSTQSSAGHAGK
ncbi:hypothetical protein [Mariprofundus ferrooxydans]|uniref:hypothetical protein n=1 Tax=Mariprofundus ferrooxydans TaxID=314344 RepID=UPI00036D6C37|nr:hypothetical protein [Mariprofundus ferrooxydans]